MAVSAETMFGADVDFHRSWQTWKGMPEFRQEDLEPSSSIVVHLANERDAIAFEGLVGGAIRSGSKRIASAWYPKRGTGGYSTKRYRSSLPDTKPRWPVFVPTKGRADGRHTIRTFEELGIPYRAVIEAQEVDTYLAAGVPEANVLVLPHRDKGLVATRNWIWDRARDEGHRYFWTFDDNIRGLFRLNRNLKTPVADGAMLRAIEDYAERYDNLPICGMNYFMFAVRKSDAIPPVYLNNRIYSNMLIQTDFRDPRGRPYRNEGYYNDDTDLCLRVLRDGNCLVLFNAFLIYKLNTMSVKGGMTSHYVKGQTVDPTWLDLARHTMAYPSGWYTDDVRSSDGAIDVEHGRPVASISAEERALDGRWRMAVELASAHPGITKIGWRFSHWQHIVDYSAWYGNELRLREGVELPETGDDYGMALERVDAQTGQYVTQDSPWYPWEDGR